MIKGKTYHLGFGNLRPIGEWSHSFYVFSFTHWKCDNWRMAYPILWDACAMTPLSLPSYPLPIYFISFYFDKLFMKHLQLMHISQNYFCQASSVTCPWDMTCAKMRRSINPHFSRTMQIMTNSIILHYVLHANLTNSEESGGLAVLLKGILSDWMIGKQHLPSPSHNPSCGHHCPTYARQLLL